MFLAQLGQQEIEKLHIAVRNRNPAMQGIHVVCVPGMHTEPVSIVWPDTDIFSGGIIFQFLETGLQRPPENLRL